jgi:hypothetical protein
VGDQSRLGEDFSEEMTLARNIQNKHNSVEGMGQGGAFQIERAANAKALR